MGKWFALAVAVGGFAASGLFQSISRAAPSPASAGKPLAQAHFAGAQAINSQQGLDAVKEILALPETTRLREQAFGNLSTNAAKAWGGGAFSPALLKPLFDDLYNFEWRAETHETQEGPPLCLLAIRAPREAAQRWSTNLWQAAAKAYGAAPAKGQLAGLSGWQSSAASHYFGLFHKGEWTLVASGPKAPPADRGLVGVLAKGAPAKADGFLSLDLSERLLAKVPALRAFSGISLAFSGQNEAVRTSGKLTLANPFTGKITPWNVPTNTIRQPLLAFTAFNAASAWLSNSPSLAALPFEKWPNQFFVWSEQGLPFSVSAAAEAGNPTNFIHKVGETLLPKWKAAIEKAGVGEIGMITDPLIISWRGMPIAVPFLRPAANGDDKFIQIGLFPAAPGKDPMPSELLAQIQRDNLLYYDWEITQGRLFQLRPLRQLHLMMTQGTLPNAQSPGEAWLAAIEPKLGNTITQITLDSPRELELARKSPIGFTATELTLFALWAQSTNFPAPRLDITGGPIPAPRTPRARPPGGAGATGAQPPQ